MLQQYKKTFPVMQALIAAVTASVFIWARVWQVAATFFLIMQVGAVLGAVWAYSLRTRIQRRQQMFSLRS
jgi:hypothetical protein